MNDSSNTRITCSSVLVALHESAAVASGTTRATGLLSVCTASRVCTRQSALATAPRKCSAHCTSAARFAFATSSARACERELRIAIARLIAQRSSGGECEFALSSARMMHVQRVHSHASSHALALQRANTNRAADVPIAPISRGAASELRLVQSAHSQSECSADTRAFCTGITYIN